MGSAVELGVGWHLGQVHARCTHSLHRCRSAGGLLTLGQGRGWCVVADLVERDGHPRQCTATSKRSHVRCRGFAVEGMSVCWQHGGASPQAREAARRRRVEAEATVLLEPLWKMDASPITNPVQALADLAGKARNALDVLGARVTVGDLDGPAGHAWLRTMRELRQMLEGLERLDLAAKALELDQQLATMIVVAFREAIGRLHLPPGDAAQITAVFLESLTFEDGEPPAVVGAIGAVTEREFVDTGAQLAAVIRAVLDRLALTETQWSEAARVVPEELRRVAGDRGAVVRGEVG
jgi:hypothetical protein